MKVVQVGVEQSIESEGWDAMSRRLGYGTFIRIRTGARALFNEKRSEYADLIAADYDRLEEEYGPRTVNKEKPWDANNHNYCGMEAEWANEIIDEIFPALLELAGKPIPYGEARRTVLTDKEMAGRMVFRVSRKMTFDSEYFSETKIKALPGDRVMLYDGAYDLERWIGDTGRWIGISTIKFTEGS